MKAWIPPGAARPGECQRQGTRLCAEDADPGPSIRAEVEPGPVVEPLAQASLMIRSGEPLASSTSPYGTNAAT